MGEVVVAPHEVGTVAEVARAVPEVRTADEVTRAPHEVGTVAEVSTILHDVVVQDG